MGKDATAEQKNEQKELQKQQKDKIPIAKGVPVSGRTWKAQDIQRHSSVKSGKAFKKTWDDKMQARQKLKDVKERERALKEEAQLKKEEEKKRAEERRKQKQENEKKASVVQVIKDSRKLKKMSRKQLKSIEKR